MKSLWNKNLRGVANTPDHKMSAGTGITSGTGTVYKASVSRDGELAKTTIYVDIDGLINGGAAGDIIGANDAANCHLGQIKAEINGTIVAGKMTCVELPAGGDVDIDVYAADEATGTENAAVTGLTETALVDAGDATLGSEVILTAFPTDGQYLYLVAGAGATTFAEYTTGKLVIELWGTI